MTFTECLVTEIWGPVSKTEACWRVGVTETYKYDVLHINDKEVVRR